MEEYIKKSEAIAKALEQLPVNEIMDNVESALMDIPPSDVAPIIHGHYIIDEDGTPSCSVCGARYIDSTQNYCPSCGARMDEPEVYEM